MSDYGMQNAIGRTQARVELHNACDNWNIPRVVNLIREACAADDKSRGVAIGFLYEVAERAVGNSD